MFSETFYMFLDYCCIMFGVAGIIVGVISGSPLTLVSGVLLALGGVGSRLEWNYLLVIVLLSAALIINVFFL